MYIILTIVCAISIILFLNIIFKETDNEILDDLYLPFNKIKVITKEGQTTYLTGVIKFRKMTEDDINSEYVFENYYTYTTTENYITKEMVEMANKINKENICFEKVKIENSCQFYFTEIASNFTFKEIVDEKSNFCKVVKNKMQKELNRNGFIMDYCVIQKFDQ